MPGTSVTCRARERRGERLQPVEAHRGEVQHQRGAVQQAAVVTIISLCLASTYVSVSASGLRGAGYVSYFVVMLAAGLLLGSRAAGGVALLAILTGFGLAYAESIGMLVLSPEARAPAMPSVKVSMLAVEVASRSAAYPGAG